MCYRLALFFIHSTHIKDDTHKKKILPTKKCILWASYCYWVDRYYYYASYIILGLLHILNICTYIMCLVVSELCTNLLLKLGSLCIFFYITENEKWVEKTKIKYIFSSKRRRWIKNQNVCTHIQTKFNLIYFMGNFTQSKMNNINNIRNFIF